MKKGFTIVELLMVIGIIAVLTSIVTTAAAGSVKNSRVRRRNALCTVVQAGLATYYAQYNKWPIELPASRTNGELDDCKNDETKIVLLNDEVRECIKKMVMLIKENKPPVIDVSGLFVSRDEGKFGQKCWGLDFMQAIHGTKKSSRKMKLDEMYFGYPESSRGYFRHFKIVYSIPADSMTVSAMDGEKDRVKFYDK